jgi:hypothetical protein
VLPQYRCQEIASALYNHIEAVLGYPRKPDPYHQTRDGQMFWYTNDLLLAYTNA